MAWEKRGNRYYYYRKRKVGDRVISEYIGSGVLAELMAEDDQQRNFERQADLEACKREFAKVLDQDREIEKTYDLIAGLTRVVLLAAGYHTHKGQWRRKR